MLVIYVILTLMYLVWSVFFLLEPGWGGGGGMKLFVPRPPPPMYLQRYSLNSNQAYMVCKALKLVYSSTAIIMRQS